MMTLQNVPSTVEQATQTIQTTSEVVNQSVQGTFLDTLEWFGNPLSAWLFSLALGLLVFWGLRLLCLVMTRSLSQFSATQTPSSLGFVNTFILKALAYVSPVVLFILALYVAEIPLQFNKSVDAFFEPFPVYALLLQVALWIKPLTKVTLSHYVDAQSDEKHRLSLQTLLGPVTFLIVLVGWILVLLVGLDFKGVNITALVTSLGVGGLALGLALQNVLGDLIASLSIALDKPFVLGDFIVTQDFKGTVTHIGLRSTRLEGLDGEGLVIPNSDLCKSRLRNYTRMQHRRVEHRFYVAHGTPLDAVKAIPDWVSDGFGPIKQATLERVHLAECTDWALVFEVVYVVEEADYTVFRNVQQAYLQGLLSLLAEKHVSLATMPYPLAPTKP
jgi:small-conductance mechanosensitive channel